MSRSRFQSETASLFPSLPTGWREERIHDVADLRTSSVDKKSEDGEAPVELCNYVDVYKNEKITAGLDFMTATATDAQIERFSVQIGDVIITKDSETAHDIGVPAYVAETKPSLVCGYHLTMIRPNEEFVHGSYLFYAVKSRLSAYQFYLAANGVTRFGLTTQGTKNLRIAFPSPVEQKQIADFLDWKTGQIDALITKKRQLIEKLQEQRIAVITQAVTNGLNPDAPMGDSGIPWLGDVPEHWEVRRLKFCFESLNNRRIPLSSEERSNMARDYPYYGASGIIDYVEDYIFDEPLSVNKIIDGFSRIFGQEKRWLAEFPLK